SFRGAAFEYADSENILTVDIGGGSTEVVIGKDLNPVRGISLDVGSVRLTEMFVTAYPTPTSDLHKIEAYVKSVLQKNDVKRVPVNELVAVAGTATTLAAIAQGVSYDSKRVHNYRLQI